MPMPDLFPDRHACISHAPTRTTGVDGPALSEHREILVILKQPRSQPAS